MRRGDTLFTHPIFVFFFFMLNFVWSGCPFLFQNHRQYYVPAVMTDWISSLTNPNIKVYLGPVHYLQIPFLRS